MRSQKKNNVIEDEMIFTDIFFISLLQFWVVYTSTENKNKNNNRLVMVQ